MDAMQHALLTTWQRHGVRWTVERERYAVMRGIPSKPLS